MSPAAEVLGLWVVFALTHVGLSSTRLRPRIVSRIGERPFQALYSVLALAIFVPLVSVYFANKHAGAQILPFERGLVLRWIADAGIGMGVVLLVAGFVQPSPASAVPGSPAPRGIHRITRHPVMMAMALYGFFHLLGNGSSTDVAFFGGFVWFPLLGAWHQDRRKLIEDRPGFRAFYEGTPFWPFTGRTLQGLREIPAWTLLIGVALAVGVRWFHAPWFGS